MEEFVKTTKESSYRGLLKDYQTLLSSAEDVITYGSCTVGYLEAKSEIQRLLQKQQEKTDSVEKVRDTKHRTPKFKNKLAQVSQELAEALIKLNLEEK